MSATSATNMEQKCVKEINGLRLYFSGEIATIVMDRGENRINTTFLRAFQHLLDIVEGNDSCKGLITTGAGKFYSNGLDLNWLSTVSEEESELFHLSMVALLKKLLFFPIPTLAALNGHAFAGGALLAFVHDVRSMRIDTGWICFNEVFLNMQMGVWTFKYLRVKMGHGKNFSDALVLGRRFTAQMAFNAGLITAVAPLNLLIQKSMQVLKSYYGEGYPKDGFAAMKEDVYSDALEWYRHSNIDEALQQKLKETPEMESKL